jgi:hypothetical protein
MVGKRLWLAAPLVCLQVRLGLSTLAHSSHLLTVEPMLAAFCFHPLCRFLLLLIALGGKAFGR